MEHPIGIISESAYSAEHKFDALVKSPFSRFRVIPAKAGIQ